MTHNFESVTVTHNVPREATIKFNQRDFDPSKGHTAEASVIDRTLTVKATFGDRIHQRVIEDVDVQAGLKVKGVKGHVIVTVNKNTEFNMKEKL